MNRILLLTIPIVLLSSGCLPSIDPAIRMGKIMSAREFTKELKSTPLESIELTESERLEHAKARASLSQDAATLESAEPAVQPVFDSGSKDYIGDNRYLAQGYSLKKSVGAAPVQVASDGDFVGGQGAHTSMQNPHPPLPPVGSKAPYHLGPQTDNPSLWPGDAQGSSLFGDFRANQAMDTITIIISESTQGSKKAETDAEGDFSLTAGIGELFGIETTKWAANNTSLDPAELIKASTSTNFEGEGETKREGSLRARISAVIMEVLPNGLLRVEGTKIVAINSEEEVLVLSGLIRPRDINSKNEVVSDRVANMRVDFYGRGVVAEQQQPGWGARIFELVWPF